MSPSWRDQVVLAVYPERVCWMRLGRGLVPEVLAHGSLACAPAAGGAWQGIVKLLPEALQAANAANTGVKVVLSNRLARYAIASNPDGTNSQEELDLLARHAFKRIHGDAVQDWDVRLSEAAPGKQALACAVDRVLVTALREAVTAAHARLDALQPYLMAAFNRFGRQLPKRDGLFVLTEPYRICQVVWKDGGWSAVQQMNVGQDWMPSLHGMLDRVAVTAGMENLRALQLCAPELPDQNFEAHPWQVQVLKPTWLKGLSPIQDKAYAGALLALS